MLKLFFIRHLESYCLRPYIKSLRKFRKYHRFIGVTLAILVLISAVTGILLSFKKDVDLLQPPTQKGVSKTLEGWKPLSELANIATTAFQKRYPNQQNNGIDKMDVRPAKGIVKVLFEKGYWEVQVDGTSGEVKSIARRHSDWIEHVHDGSIISDWFKLLSMNTLGIGLLILMGSGLWLWYGPRKVKAHRRKAKKLNAD